MGADDGDLLIYSKSQLMWEAVLLNISGPAYLGSYDPRNENPGIVHDDGKNYEIGLFISILLDGRRLPEQ